MRITANQGKRINIVVFLLLLMGVSLAYSQTQKTNPKLEVSIRSQKITYSLKEDLQLEIQLTNTGTDSLFIDGGLFFDDGRLNLWIFDEKGKQVYPALPRDLLPPPPPNKRNFLELHTDEFFGLRINDPMKNLVNSPGTYEIVVDYMSFIPEDWARKYLRLPIAKLWTLERGKVTSNRIRITVTE
jgi:hypothetical protein